MISEDHDRIECAGIDGAIFMRAGVLQCQMEACQRGVAIVIAFYLGQRGPQRRGNVGLVTMFDDYDGIVGQPSRLRRFRQRQIRTSGVSR